MSNLDNRLQRLEQSLGTEEKPILVILPDTTFEQARAEYEAKTGDKVTEEEFKNILPTCRLILVVYVSEKGKRQNKWVEAYREKT